MTAYLVARANVTDPDAYQEYARRVPDILAKYGGTFHARGGRSVTLEGDAARKRIVVIEFGTVEQAEAYYNSPEYQEAKAFREGAADMQIAVVEGL